MAGNRRRGIAVNDIGGGGGTDPTRLLRIDRKKIKNGGMIFISDGEFTANCQCSARL